MSAGMIRDAYLYGRVSTKTQLSGLGLVTQQESMQTTLAKRPDWRLAGSFADLGIPAFRGANKMKGELGRFLALVRDGSIKRGSVLIIYSLDRMSRNVIIEAQGLILDLLRADIAVCTTNDGNVYDPDGDHQTMVFSMVMSLLVMARAHEENLARAKKGKDTWATRRTAARATGKAIRLGCGLISPNP